MPPKMPRPKADPRRCRGSPSNRGVADFELKPMKLLAQLVLVPVIQAAFVETRNSHESQRGGSGFGSRGGS